MNQRELATNYLRYYSSPGRISDNAPQDLRDWVATLPRTTDRYMIQTAFELIAGKQQAPNTTSFYAAWFANRPAEYSHCDAILRSKKPPATFAELMERAYTSAQHDVTEVTRKFVSAQLTNS